VRQDRLDRVRIVFDAQRVRHGREDGVRFGDGSETTTEEPILRRVRIGFSQADPYPACLRSALGDWSMLPYDPMSPAGPRIIHEPITRAELADLATAS